MKKHLNLICHTEATPKYRHVSRCGRNILARIKPTKQSINSSFRGCEATEESHEIKTKRFFGRSRLFNLNRKFNAIPLNDGRSFAFTAARGFSCSQTKAYRNAARGFTLAEVLITLTIIGVIAALTIPNLMQSYKKSQIETNLKSAYTILQNALTIAQANNGSLEEMVDACNTGTRDEKANCFMDNYLKPNLKYSKSCNCEDRTCSGIFPVDTYKKLDGTTINQSKYQPLYHATLKLNNGIPIGIQWIDSAAPTFMVDVNGHKGPNQLGTDLFYFTLEEHDNKANDFVSKGLRCGRRYYNYNTALNCGINEGAYCSCPIMYNGWKIPDNYPVKKF